ncbi:MAG TPA: molybdenum cofactor biosynthesis protein MoaE [Gemmatimonadales bacterium]|nr:molybdenum cofactor biosynthesis protein MoaE [Gemmatimonadales bacterium]
MTNFLTRDSIFIDRLLRAVASPEHGGTCLFIGTVRSGSDESAPVTDIEYSAYDEMVEVEMARIVDEVRSRWPVARVALQHRIGIVPLGQASIAVVAAAPHRDVAFQCCRYVIEEVKRRVPIWKKERHADGTAEWVDARTRTAIA